jgi:hypothetical protein
LGSLHTTDETANSISDMFNFSQKPTKFVPEEPLPPKATCGGHASTQHIIENDGGVPE